MSRSNTLPSLILQLKSCAFPWVPIDGRDQVVPLANTPLWRQHLCPQGSESWRDEPTIIDA